MNTNTQFDNITKLFARPTTRRQAFGLGIGALGALVLGRTVVFATTNTPTDYVLDPNGSYPIEGGACYAINDYSLGGLTELSSSASHIHVEFWSPSAFPSEMEAVLKTANVPGGRFLFTQTALSDNLQGHVWEMGPSCSDSQAKADTDGQIKRRLAGEANNAGWAPVDVVKSLFVPAVGGNTGTTPATSAKPTQSTAAPAATAASSAKSTAASTGSATPSADTPMQGCPGSTSKQYKDGPVDVTVQGPAIVQPWWNNGVPSFGQTQVRVILAAGTKATFLQMQGWTYTYVDNAACRHNLPFQFANGASLQAMHLSDLESEGLVKVDTKGADQDNYPLN